MVDVNAILWLSIEAIINWFEIWIKRMSENLLEQFLLKESYWYTPATEYWDLILTIPGFSLGYTILRHFVAPPSARKNWPIAFRIIERQSFLTGRSLLRPLIMLPHRPCIGGRPRCTKQVMKILIGGYRGPQRRCLLIVVRPILCHTLPNAMGRAFCCVSGSLLRIKFLEFHLRLPRNLESASHESSFKMKDAISSEVYFDWWENPILTQCSTWHECVKRMEFFLLVFPIVLIMSLTNLLYATDL